MSFFGAKSVNIPNQALFASPKPGGAMTRDHLTPTQKTKDPPSHSMESLPTRQRSNSASIVARPF